MRPTQQNEHVRRGPGAEARRRQGPPRGRSSSYLSLLPRSPLSLMAGLVLGLLLGLGAWAQGTQEFEVNGLKVLLKPVAANEVVAVRLYLLGGSQNLTPETAGIENLTLQVMSQGGTEKYPKEALNAALAALGTSFSVEAGFDYSVLAMRCVRRNFVPSWDLWAEVVCHPTFPEAEVQRLRAQVVAAIRQGRDDPDDYIWELAENLFYANHPYGNRPQGKEEVVARLGREDLVAYHRTHFEKSRLRLVVVGNVTAEELRRLVDDTLARLPAGDYPGWQKPPAVNPEAPGVVFVERELPTNYLLALFPAPGLDHPDYYPMLVALSILSHRLEDEIRTRRHLAYAVYSWLSLNGTARGFTFVTTADPNQAVKLIFAEIDRLQQEPIDPKTLQDQIHVFLTLNYLRQETNEALARQLLAHEILGHGWEQMDEFIDRIRAVQPADIQRLAQQYIHHLQWAVIGNPGAVDEALLRSR